MRLLFLLVLLPWASANDECVIVALKEATCIDFEASIKVTGVNVTKLGEKLALAATDPEDFGDMCAEACCNDEKCNVAEVSFEEKDDACQLIACDPLEKCIWKGSVDTISIVIDREQLPSSVAYVPPSTTPYKPPQSASPTQATGVTSHSANVSATPSTPLQATNPQAADNPKPSGPNNGASPTTAAQSSTTNKSTAQSTTLKTTTQQFQSATPTSLLLNSTQASTTKQLNPQPTTLSSNKTATSTTLSANGQKTSTRKSPTPQTASSPIAPVPNQSAASSENVPVSNNSTAPIRNNNATATTVGNQSQTSANATRPLSVPNSNDKLSSYSLAAIFGTSITVSLLVVFIVSHRFYESWKRRHYKQINTT